MTQLNSPYPAVAYLSGFLQSAGWGGEVFTADLSLALALKLFSRAGLEEIFKSVFVSKKVSQKLYSNFGNFSFIQQNQIQILDVIDDVIMYLQNANPTLAYRIASQNFLPAGPRTLAFLNDDQESVQWAFGSLGLQDKSKFLATLLLSEITDFVKSHIDPRFELARYGEKLAASKSHFDELQTALTTENPTIIDQWIDVLAEEVIQKNTPDLILLTVPFPGNVLGALRIAKVARGIKLVRPKFFHRPIIGMGGGWVNTELRSLREPRLFNYIDFATLDDGERPLIQVLEQIKNQLGPLEQDGVYPLRAPLLRTFIRQEGQVKFLNDLTLHDIPQQKTGTPDYSGLPLTKYVSLLEMMNPMHRLWSDLRWNKLTIAHGCYWKKCTFCDVSLDYISKYENTPTDILIEKILKVIHDTGTTGFHFVDEAAPPAALKALSEKLIEKKIKITWWTNIRFEKSFTPELCELMAKAGCVAVTGGLEVASDRLLKFMQKGVTVKQVAQVTKSFSDCGVMVHAYLMYGFPSQTHLETLESLERVRQLFEQDCIQSAFWHRFSATAHSPVGLNPQEYGLKLDNKPQGLFAHNDLDFVDLHGDDPSLMTEGLNKALYNYMHGLGFEISVRDWFPQLKFKEKIKVPKDFVLQSLMSQRRTNSIQHSNAEWPMAPEL
jgi:radical SAM superfamily enzyme YgiQ (UPF0313 family)